MKQTLLLYFFFFYAHTLTAQNLEISDSEAIQTATALEMSVKKGDATFLSNFFDLNALDDRIKLKSIAAQKSKAMFNGFKSTFNMNDLAKQVVVSLHGSSYQFIRIYQINNRRHLLFRVFGKHGVNYQDFELIKVNNLVKAQDMFVYLSGEDISVTLADLLDANMPHDADYSKVSGDLKWFLKLKEYKRNNDYKAIVAMYDSLSDALRKNHAVQIIYISACQRLGATSVKYKQALENYAAMFPDAPNTPFLMIDLYLLNKEYDKSLNAINRLDSFVHDPFLNFLRASICLLKNDKKQAKVYYDSVFEKYPTISYTIKNVIALHMNDGEKSIAKTDLEIYKKCEDFNQQYIDEIYLMYPELKD